MCVYACACTYVYHILAHMHIHIYICIHILTVNADTNLVLPVASEERKSTTVDAIEAKLCTNNPDHTMMYFHAI
jgi:hypothetical protein